MKNPINRRFVISAAFTLLTADALARHRDRDRGIGGTGSAGVFSEPDDGDRGIGGTGVIGTIRKFGSIIVNDIRIAYPAAAEVEIDGRATTSKDLRLGQVVHTVATANGAGFVTSRIMVTSEVVGPIEGLTHGKLSVLGQAVATDFVDARTLKIGQWVAVSGLRGDDGTIYASYIQHRDDSLAQVAGPVSIKNGVAQIGGLPLVNLDTALEGRRVLAQVGRLGGQPAAVNATPDPELAAMPGVRHLSIEAYVARRGNEMRMGSGLTATVAPTQVSTSTAPASTAPASTAPARAVVTVTVDSEGSMSATAAQRPVANPTTAPTPDHQPPKTAPQQKRDAERDPDKKNSKTDKTQTKGGADDARSNPDRDKADKAAKKGGADDARSGPDHDKDGKTAPKGGDDDAGSSHGSDKDDKTSKKGAAKSDEAAKTETKASADRAKASVDRDAERTEPTKAPEPPPPPQPRSRR